MRIGIYTDEFHGTDGGGFSLTQTMIREIRDRASQGEDKDQYFILFHGGKKQPYKKESNPVEINIDQLCLCRGNRLTQQAEKFYQTVYEASLHKIHRPRPVLDRITEKEGLDLIWIMQPSLLELHTPYIFTIWDLGEKTASCFPEVRQYDGLFHREHMVRKMAGGAAYVTIANETGRREIVENYHISPDKIRLVQFPIADFCYGEEKKPDLAMPEHYFLYPAQFWAHKNHVCIIDALKILREQYEIKANVIFTGSDHGNLDYIKEYARDAGVEEQIIYTGFVEDTALKYLYRHADALVYASLMGPNNMPPMEAAYLGCPVIITDLPGHREEMQDGALYFNGYHPEELAEQMRKAIRKDPEIEEVQKYATRLAEEFNKIDGFEQICGIIDEYRQIRKRWKARN